MAPVRRLEQLGGRPVAHRRPDAARRRSAPPAAEPVDLLSDRTSRSCRRRASTSYGVTFPGIPGIILGTNGKVAWPATVVDHDVNDVYLETIAPCTTGGGDCVDARRHRRSPIEPCTETIKIGALGTITGHVDRDLRDRAAPRPDHPDDRSNGTRSSRAPRRRRAQRRSTPATSRPSRSARSGTSRTPSTVDDGFTALADFTLRRPELDDDRQPAATSAGPRTRRCPIAHAARVHVERARPTRTGSRRSSSCPATAAPTGHGRMDTRYVPHAIDPAPGYLATANARSGRRDVRRRSAQPADGRRPPALRRRDLRRRRPRGADLRR